MPMIADLEEDSAPTKMNIKEKTNKPQVIEATKEEDAVNAVPEAAEEARMPWTNLLRLKQLTMRELLRRNKREKLSHLQSPLPRTTTTPAESIPQPPSLPTPPLNLLSKRGKANQMLLTE